MTKKERIEDLGRIYVHLEQVLDHPMWDFKPAHSRDKDFAEIFQQQDADKQHDQLHDLAYHMSAMRELLYNMLVIAQGDEESELDGILR